MILIAPQSLKFSAIGAMKSLSAALNESDDRLLRYAEPKPEASVLASGEDVEVDLGLTEGARAQRAQAIGIAGRNGGGVDRAGPSPASSG